MQIYWPNWVEKVAYSKKLLYFCSMDEVIHAIVLHHTRHSDQAVVVQLYTREYGRIPCMVYGKKWLSVLQTMSEVELRCSSRPNQDMRVLKSAALSFVPQRIPTDVARQCMLLFMGEVMEKTLRHPMADEAVYAYINKVLRELDITEEPQNLPQQFLTTLSELLGYGGQRLDEWNHLKSEDIIRHLWD